MRDLFLTLACLSLLLTTALAQDPPVLSNHGLEAYRLNEMLPAEDSLPGVSHKVVTVAESAEGMNYNVQYAKIFYKGYYLGRAKLDGEGLIEELEIVSDKVRHQAGYRVGSTWRELQMAITDPTLHYTYVSESLFATSPEIDTVQAHFDTRDYRGKAALSGEYQTLANDALPDNAKIKMIRMFTIAEE